MNVTPKLQSLKNFLTNPNSEESKNYISDLLTGETSRPEELFVQKFLNVDFWKELGYDDKELKFERYAGVSGRVEWTLKIDGKLIAIECKRPYFVKKDKEIKNELDGNDIDELKEQIGPYLLSHQFIIFTNGFHWYFYSRESYRAWLNNKDKKNNKLNPYFKHLTSEEIFQENSQEYILNFLQRHNILDTLRSNESKSIRHVLSEDFFADLKNWVHYIDAALKDTPSDERVRTTSLINKLIFLRTMEAVGAIPNNFLTKNWEIKKGLRKSVLGFVDQIDDDFSEIYDTELFTSRYLEDDNGNEIIEKGGRVPNPERNKNYPYKELLEEFFSALFKQTDEINLKDTGITKLILKSKTYYIRSLYWWKFESVSGDILGKAYETYLAQERKSLGIYYTPHQLTEYITSQTVSYVFDNEIIKLKKEFERESWDIEKIKTIGKKISEIKICDPSCGSGSFLTQTIRIVWEKYAELEKLIIKNDDKFTKGQATLDPHFTDNVAVLQFLRVVFRINDRQQRLGTLILRHIFGNDKDEKAADTAKLNVWLECLRLDPNSYRKESLKGKRHVLPNLELNITTGDSLIGLDIELTDKALDGEPRKTIESIFNLRKLYVESFDKTSMAHDAVILRDGLIEYFLKNAFKNKIGDKMFASVSRIGKPTFWALQHWDAFYDEKGNLKSKEQRGFDVIIGNPPWEKLKTQDREFFAIRAPEIANTSTASKRKKMIQELQKTKTGLYNEYIDAKKNSEIQADYLRKSKKFPFSVVGDLNLYPIFLELSHNLLKKDGMLGMIVQTGILTDLSYQRFFEHLVFTSSIIACHDFTNKRKIFKDVAVIVRFCLMFLTTTESNNENFSLSILNEKVEDIEERTSNMSKNDLILFNPNSKACTLFVKNQDYKICKKIYQNNSVLINIKKNSNPWSIEYWRMFDMTNDSGLFEQKESLIKKGFTKNDNSWFIKNNLRFVPLYESKFFSNYEHRHGSFEGVPEENRFGVKAEPYHPNNEEKKNTKYEIEPRYWVSEKDVLNKYKSKNVALETCFVFRDVCRAFTDSRTAKGTIIPFSAAGNTAPVLIFRNQDVGIRKKEMIIFSHIFSSFVFDYIVRQKISGAHLSKYILEQIASPEPNKFREMNFKYNNNTKSAEKWLLENSSKIFPVTQNFKDLFEVLNISKPIKWNEDDRFDQICFANAMIAHVYGLDKNDFEYILNQFPILKKQEEEKYGKFLSFDKCLDYFNKIQIIN